MSRADIFAKIESATAALQVRAAYPNYDLALVHSAPKLAGEDLWEIFARNFNAVNNNQRRGYCDPALYQSIGAKLAAAGLTVETEYDRKIYDSYQFGITRATGAIAESGSVILDDENTSHRLAALSPWVHVAVLQRGEIHRTIPDAIAAFGKSPNIIWCTGPSKTADVEGILIEGVHGPGEQIALLVESC
jgi:L-lactate dehydrogenase complex protein LldG